MNTPAQTMKRADRAAVFLTLLGDEEAAKLLALLEPEDLEQLGSAMCALGEIGREGIAESLADFVTEADREVLPKQDRSAQVRELFERSLGPVKAQSMMQRIEPEQRPRSIEMARWLAPPIIVKLVEGEHPQVIAALLLMLEPEPAARVLSELPEEIQTPVVTRVARIGPISDHAVDMIDRLLTQQIGQNFGPSALKLGGAREAANLINLAAGNVSQTVLPAIALEDADLAAAIEEQMFTFEMLFELDPQGMGRLLRDVDNEALVDALKGLDEETRELFFAGMSSRAADGVKDEIELRGRLSMAEVREAQRKIVEVARELKEQGEIVLGADDGEFV